MNNNNYYPNPMFPGTPLNVGNTNIPNQQTIPSLNKTLITVI